MRQWLFAVTAVPTSFRTPGRHALSSVLASRVRVRVGLAAVHLVLLSVALTSCGFLPARRPLGPTSLPPTPTPRPAPLVRAGGHSVRWASAPILPPVLGWTAIWAYDCSSSPANWRVSISVWTMRPRLHRHSQVIVVATSPKHRHAHGSTTIVLRGEQYVDLRVTEGCAWSLRGEARV